ncbi:MAG TPA: hypothetical protein VHM64_14580 [Candidatus Binatia bacterium]|nr:hypothetical protein [Candidatus Binatia bacterium]
MGTRFSLLERISAQLAIALLITAGVFAADAVVCSMAAGSNHYTEKQITVLAERLGKTFWIREVNGRTPNFLSAADRRAASFRARTGDSFQIVELVGRSEKNPYYKVKFESGKEGYLRPETILEELNLTILTVDPLANERREAAKQAAQEKERVDWINAQPWPVAAKEAALKGNVVPGMTVSEVKRIAGAPSRVVKVESRGAIPEEHWFYADGKLLIFQRGLLSQIAVGNADNR